MPSRFSKYVVDATCKEYSHPWTDSCANATAGLGLHTVQESLRIYSTLYVVTLLMKGKIPSKDDIRKTILAILQSTAFLSCHSFSYSIFICSLRRVLGHLNILTVSFIPSFLSSLLSIYLERPSRRTLLCLYVSNVATETLFRMGVWRGYFSAIPRGEVYIFALSMAVLSYFFRSKTDKQDSIYKMIRVVIGKYEETDPRKLHSTDVHTRDTKFKYEKSNVTSRCQKHTFTIVWKSLRIYQHIIEYVKNRSKHISCPHPYSCMHYILTGGVRLFSYGVGVQLLINLFFQARRVVKQPKLMKSLIFRKGNLGLAIFLGGFASLYRFISCALRRLFDKDSETYAVPAGIIASTAFMAYPDNTIALYCMWKALQLLWNHGVEKGKLPEVKWFPVLLYCLSTATLFHAAIVEPQNLRPAYWKFLHNSSGGRIAVMSRKPLDSFGLGTSKALQEVLRKTHTTDQITYRF